MFIKRFINGIFGKKTKTYTSIEQKSTKPPRVLLWALAGVVLGLCIAVLTYAPAQWLAYAVGRISGQRVLLSEAQGTVWQGSARLVLQGGQGSRDATALPTRLYWQLKPIWLGANAQFISACCTTTPVKLRISYNARVWRIKPNNTHINLPTHVLAGLGTPWNTLQLQGALQLQTHDAVFVLAQQRGSFQGKLQARLHQMSTRLSTISPLGNYTLDITGDTENTVHLDLQTQPNSILQLQGAGQYTGGRWHFLGEARANAQYATALDNLLNIIGQRDGERSIITLG